MQKSIHRFSYFVLPVDGVCGCTDPRRMPGSFLNAKTSCAAGISPSLFQSTLYLRELKVGHVKVPHARARRSLGKLHAQRQRQANTATYLAGIISAQHQTVPDQARSSPYCCARVSHSKMKRANIDALEASTLWNGHAVLLVRFGSAALRFAAQCSKRPQDYKPLRINYLLITQSPARHSSTQ